LKDKILSTLKYLVLISVGIILILLAFKGINLEDIFNALQKANWIWLVPTFLFLALSHYIRGLRWNMLIESLGYKTSAFDSFYAVCIGYLVNIAVPRLGEITRCTILSKTQKSPVESLLGTVFLERIIDMLTVLLLLFSLLAFKLDLLGNYFYHLTKPLMDLIIQNWQVCLFGFLLLALGMFIFIKTWLKNLLAVKALAKVLGFLRGMGEGMLSIKKLRNPLGFVFYSLLIWALYLFTTIFVFKCLESTRDLGLGEGLAVLIAGGFGMAAPTPGGIGSYHLLVSEVLTLFQISKAEGLAAATLSHGSQTVFLIVLGAFSFLMIFVRKPSHD